MWPFTRKKQGADTEWANPHTLHNLRANDDLPPPGRGPENEVVQPAALPFEQRIGQLGLRDLFHTSQTPMDDATINLATLQRMSLCAIQRDLVAEVGKIETMKMIGATQMTQVKTLMSDYATALRDWELILDYSARAKNSLRLDPFTLTSARSLELAMMHDAGLVSPINKKASDCRDFIDPILPGGSRKHLNRNRNKAAFWERLYMAGFGGIALVGPMLIMALHHGKATSLTTVSLSVLIFAVLVARYSTGTPEIVLGAVAAYAAVLVVFVGTTN